MAEASALYPVTEVEGYRYAPGVGRYFAEGGRVEDVDAE